MFGRQNAAILPRALEVRKQFDGLEYKHILQEKKL
jgi:hypothetical protein